MAVVSPSGNNLIAALSDHNLLSRTGFGAELTVDTPLPVDNRPVISQGNGIFNAHAQAFLALKAFDAAHLGDMLAYDTEVFKKRRLAAVGTARNNHIEAA